MGKIEFAEEQCALYLDSETEVCDADTPCAILDPSDSDDPGVIDPEFAVTHSLKYALYMSDLDGVVRNAQQQVRNPGISVLLDALNYYLEFDAFIRIP